MEKGADLHYATVDGLDLDDTSIKPRKVYATDKSGERHEFPCTDFVLAAGPWSGSLAEKILPKRMAKKINVSGERAHSVRPQQKV